MNTYMLWSLTPRRRQIALLVCKGKTNLEIANDLGICIKTVKESLTHTYKELKVRGRAQLIYKLLYKRPVPEPVNNSTINLNTETVKLIPGAQELLTKG